MLILATLVLALAPAPAARERRTPPGPTGPGECPAVRVTSPQLQPGRGAFSASRALDLRITTAFPRTLEGKHRLHLRVLTPQGHLYQKFSVPFDATVPSEGRGPSPKRTISVRLPVAGTAITTNGLYGRWTVVPSLDDQAAPCAREHGFVLEP